MHKVIQTQIKVICGPIELAGIIKTEVLRIQMVQIGARLDKGSLRLAHLFAIDRQEAMDKYLIRRLDSSHLQHRRPEEAVETHDIFADEVIEFRLRIVPPGVNLLLMVCTPLLK